MAEATFHLQDAWLVLAMVEKGLIQPSLDIQKELTHLLQLAKRYRDQVPDLADLCLIRMSEIFSGYSVITTDVRNFKIYRRNKRERIPIISPE